MRLIQVLLFLILINFISCGSPEEVSHENIETKIDTTFEENIIVVEDHTEEPIPFKKAEWVESEFSEPQLDLSYYHLYGLTDQILYETEAMEVSTSSFILGSRLLITERTGIPYTDPYNYPGEIVKIATTDGFEGYTFDNYFSRMPYPASNQTELSAYAILNFHIIDSVIYEGKLRNGKDIDYESDWQKYTYPFENDIQLITENSWEASSTVLYVPSLSIIEGLLFMDALKSDFKLFETLEGYPGPSHEKSKVFKDDYWGGYSYELYFSEGELNEIEFFYGEGCGEWINIKRIRTGIELDYGGGC